MKSGLIAVCGVFLLTGCLGQGKRQAQGLERRYGMPMSEILAKERPRQIAARLGAGETAGRAGAGASPITRRPEPSTPK